jgi:hypothetical protein
MSHWWYHILFLFQLVNYIWCSAFLGGKRRKVGRERGREKREVLSERKVCFNRHWNHLSNLVNKILYHQHKYKPRLIEIYVSIGKCSHFKEGMTLCTMEVDKSHKYRAVLEIRHWSVGKRCAFNKLESYNVLSTWKNKTKLVYYFILYTKVNSRQLQIS